MVHTLCVSLFMIHLANMVKKSPLESNLIACFYTAAVPNKEHCLFFSIIKTLFLYFQLFLSSFYL